MVVAGFRFVCMLYNSVAAFLLFLLEFVLVYIICFYCGLIGLLI